MSLTIHKNCPEHLDRFIALNEQWIEKYFQIEPSDRALADDPASVWEKGGAIYTGTIDKKVVGCCALFNKGEGLFELARMAVDPAFQGRGIGRQLAGHALSELKTMKARRVELMSNCVLKPAIALYRSLGFEVLQEGKHSVYSRCNVVMSMDLTE